MLADRLSRRMRGLIGHGELKPGDGLVLRPSWSVHTFFLRYPIDVVFVDADQVVMKVVANLTPWKWATCRGARDVVELRAGECSRANVEPGQRVAWAARPGKPPAAEAQTGSGKAQEPQATPNGVTRVLLGTTDDRFLRLARFLLTRQNVQVEVARRLPRTCHSPSRGRS